MRTEFKFSNLLGTVYGKGNICFSPEGKRLFSPVGNRVTVFNLVENTSYTLPLAHRRHVVRIAVSSNGILLLTVDEDGHTILTNLHRKVPLYYLSLKGPVSALAFSPCGQYFAVGLKRMVEIWRMPDIPGPANSEELGMAPFTKHHTHAGHHDTVQSITWSSDSRFLLTASKDLTAGIWSLREEDNFTPTILSGHREQVCAAWFSGDQEIIFTISKDGALFQWRYTSLADINGTTDSLVRSDTQTWRIVERHYFFRDSAQVSCSSFHAASNLLVVGFSSGQKDSSNLIMARSISQSEIDFVEFNDTSEWLAFGASRLGQLLVWEWQSESFILKQQGHFDALTALAYTADGQQVITGSKDGKVKIWDSVSGFCVVTFTEHTSEVTACCFSRRGNVLFTSSLDGSVRAWDLIRYRNFRTFTAPTRLPFSALAVDPSGEVICAGSFESFDICVWSTQNGQLLDQLAGHEGPVSSLAFTPDGHALISGSWDHTVRIWSIFTRTQSTEPLQLQSDVLCVAVSADSKQVAVSTLNGTLSFWSISAATQQQGIDARQDASRGRKLTSRQTAVNATGSTSFNTLNYSTDGTCVLAGGNSKYICLYDVKNAILLKKFTISSNLSLDSTQAILNSRNLTETGRREAYAGENSDLNAYADDASHTTAMNGQQDMANRLTRPEIRVRGVAFSPAGTTFCAASTEGLLLYSLQLSAQFDPLDLSIDITASNIREATRSGHYLRALIMSFRLGETSLIQMVYRKIPVSEIRLVVSNLPGIYTGSLLRFAAQSALTSPYLELNMTWIGTILNAQGNFLKANQLEQGANLRFAQRAIMKAQSDLARLTDRNSHSIDYVMGKAVKNDNAMMKGQELDMGS